MARTVIPKADEARLVDWITECARRGFGRTKAQVQKEVQKILNDNGTPSNVFTDNKPGKTWLKNFMERHPEISSRTPQGVSPQRACVTEGKIKYWFEQAQKDIEEVGGDVLSHPSRIFNCDETGFQLGGGGLSKVLVRKADRTVYQVSSDTHSQITVLATASASGHVHEPLIIFPGQRFNFDPLEGFPGAHFAKSPKGWIDSEIFAEWLRSAFVPATQHLPKPIVLFADGHTTHATMAASDICRENGIIMYQLPSHSSHIIQPLDLTTFKKLKEAWKGVVQEYRETNCDVVGKREFSKCLKMAWEIGIHRDNVASGFRAAGIYPWDPDHFDKNKTAPSRIFQINCTTSSTPHTVTPSTSTFSLTEPLPTSSQSSDAQEVESSASVAMAFQGDHSYVSALSTTSLSCEAPSFPASAPTELLTTMSVGSTIFEIDFQGDIIIDPPSPIYQSALSPLSPLASTSYYVPPSTLTPASPVSTPATFVSGNIDFQGDIIIDPPSPIYQSTLPPLSPLPSTSYYVPPTTLTPASPVSTPATFVSGKIDFQGDIIIDPPSPIYQSALPPLSPLPSTSDYVPPSTLTPASPVSTPATSVSGNVTASALPSTQPSIPSSTFAARASNKPLPTGNTLGPSLLEGLDRLLDVTAKAGVDGLIHNRTIFTLGTETSDPEETLFRRLYGHLRSHLTLTGTSENDDRPRTFDDLPLPSKWTSKKEKHNSTSKNGQQ